MKKRTHKKPPRKIKSKKKSYQKMITIAITAIATVLLATLVAFLFFVEKEKTHTQLQQQEYREQNKKITTFEEKTKALEIEYAQNIDNTLYIEKQPEKKEPKFHFEEPIRDDFEEVVSKQKETIKKEPTEDTPQYTEKTTKKREKKDLPKLAIIIDDVTTSYQVKTLSNLGYKVNISFLPPTQGHPNSARVARDLENYMIHLPLQASSFKYEEEDTLYTTDSFETIKERVQYLKRLYPKARYINNHTGSKFTADQEAMDKLFLVLKQENLTFVDSKTTPHSVAQISAKKYGKRILTRNIFLDNYKDKKYITNQLQKAIDFAKKYGSAIAIGHPYRATFETLKESHPMFEGIELVYIDQL